MVNKTINDDYYLILAGGVGAAKFIEGLAHVIDQKNLKIIVNTGDDIELFGLKICPDLDIITYTLADVVDKGKGWGFVDETFNCLSILKKYYDTGWFNAGDKDLATHIYRTDLFKQGFSKAQITQKICQKLGVKAEIIPMSNESVETHIITEDSVMHFEEFFIKHKCEPEIKGIQFRGMDKTNSIRSRFDNPFNDIFDYIENAKKIIICPSNPIVSIGTILRLKGVKEALIHKRNKVFGISPIIEGAAVKGPADKLMEYFGLEVSCVGVAHYYQEFLGHFIIDNKDCERKREIEKLNIKTYCFDTLMTSINKKVDLARFIIEL